MVEKRRRLSRRTYLKGAAAAGAIGLAGCTGGPSGGGGGNGSGGNGSSGGSGGGNGNGLEIIHWWTAGGEQDALNALLEGFRQEYPDV